VSSFDLNGLLAVISKAKEAAHTVEKDAALLRDALVSTEQQILGGPSDPAPSDAPRVFEALVAGEKRALSKRQTMELRPQDFQLFVDLVFLRLAGTEIRGGKAVIDLGEASVQREDLLILELLLRNQGLPLSRFSLDQYETKGPKAVAKHICRLRKLLGDSSHSPRLIRTEKNACLSRREGWGYRIPHGPKCCLIARSPRQVLLGEAGMPAPLAGMNRRNT